MAAFAIPAYRSYQEDAKKGVSESVLQVAARTIQLNQSLDKDTTTADLSSKVQSKGAVIDKKVWFVGCADANGRTCTVLNLIKEATTWCAQVTAPHGSNKEACIQQDGTITHKDVDSKNGKCVATTGACS